MLYGVAKRILFQLDAEAAHDFVTRQMARIQNVPIALAALASSMRSEGQPRSLWGLVFRNPLGIAAGFDKNAELIAFLRALGFGFIEIGTVTLRPQPGNPKPRMFRYPAQQALVNRLGFNNEGADAVARRLESYWGDVGTRRDPSHPPLFANIGKNKDVALDAAAENYLAVYERLAPLADGIVVNVSSPNTPSLRDLQRPEQLEGLLSALRQARVTTKFLRGQGEHPIIVKIAPDLDPGQLREVCDVTRRLADGMTATNTTIDGTVLGVDRVETGGISGRPVFASSNRILANARRLMGPGYPLIGVGGIFDAADAQAKFDAGADLVQAYTGFVYRGPGFAKAVVEGLGR